MYLKIQTYRSIFMLRICDVGLTIYIRTHTASMQRWSDKGGIIAMRI